ncbi:hypothetical protein AB0M79_22055 [Polymorphospora sp. NPDC051019]|uniref:hypothetical protein n=1 Tax=Polymorphospora sp. NPDC051019 TaxID=3155725 RepID=UPI003442C4E5
MASTRKRMVVFFEIRDKDEAPFGEPIPWAEHLAEIALESADQRRHRINGIDHWGQIYPYQDTDHLILARLLDNVSSYDTNTGDIYDIESDSGKPWVEFSIIHFIPGTNKIGFVLGSQSSPRVSSLQAWMNLHCLVDGGVSIVPVLSDDALSKIKGAAEASVLRVQYESNQLNNLQSVGMLGNLKRVLSEDMNNISVELVLKVEGGLKRGRERERLKLHKIAKDVSHDEFRSAVVKIVNYRDDGKAYGEDIDYLRHRIARKESITITDREGNPVKMTSAIDAIYRAVDRLKDDLYDH